MKVKIEKSWLNELNYILKKKYFINLINKVKEEYKFYEIYPEGKNIFNAFELCPFNNVKVVILGQDPYHGKNQANGLSFSVNKNINLPPSLKNIFKELKYNYPDIKFKDGDLSDWAKQGVLLLNSVLTVRYKSPGSHSKLGWEKFTDSVINLISQKKDNIVFILWGAFAKSKKEIIERKDSHLILMSPHPSPFSAYKGFFDQNHFRKANDYLEENGIEIINW